MLSTAIAIIVTLLVVGLLLWAIDSMPWINADVKKLIHILVIVLAVLWCIQLLFGTNWGSLHLAR
jgi:hypothetical protein